MRLVATKTLKEGSQLAKSIWNDRGQILIKENVVLTERMISRMIDMNIDYVYIRDKKTDDILAVSPVTEKLRREAVQTIESTFKQIQNEKLLSGSLVLDKAVKPFTNLIKTILSELQNNKELLTLLADVCIHDDYIFTHSFNVTLYSLAIGMELKLPPQKLEILGLGAILHDVGKMLIPREVLLKPDKLTSDEYNTMKQHAEFGFQLIRKIHSVPLIVAHCAYQHHERLDGSGYPRGLKKQEIHEFGRMIAVADVYDAVTSNRVYRRAMLPHEGLEILYAGAGWQFDQKIVEAFRKSVAVYPVGMTVKLNDGRQGVVSEQNNSNSERPIIRILKVKDVWIDQPYDIDLNNELDLMIIDCDTTFQQ